MSNKTVIQDQNEPALDAESSRQDSSQLSPSVATLDALRLRNHPDWNLIGVVGPIKIQVLQVCPGD